MQLIETTLTLYNLEGINNYQFEKRQMKAKGSKRGNYLTLQIESNQQVTSSKKIQMKVNGSNGVNERQGIEWQNKGKRNSEM